jgi:hypothetical protein
MLCDALSSIEIAKDPSKQLKPFPLDLAAQRLTMIPRELVYQIEKRHNPSPNLLGLFGSLPDLVMKESEFSANGLIRAVVCPNAPQNTKCGLLTVLLDQGFNSIGFHLQLRIQILASIRIPVSKRQLSVLPSLPIRWKWPNCWSPEVRICQRR